MEAFGVGWLSLPASWETSSEMESCTGDHLDRVPPDFRSSLLEVGRGNLISDDHDNDGDHEMMSECHKYQRSHMVAH